MKHYTNLESEGTVSKEAVAIMMAILGGHKEWAFDETQEALKDALAKSIAAEVILSNTCLLSGTFLNLPRLRGLLHERRRGSKLMLMPHREATVDDSDFFITIFSRC